MQGKSEAALAFGLRLAGNTAEKLED